jgi:hypothetical protein
VPPHGRVTVTVGSLGAGPEGGRMRAVGAALLFLFSPLARPRQTVAQGASSAEDFHLEVGLSSAV